MADLSLLMGGDLAVAANGDLLTVAGPAETQQRVLRRLITNPGDYLWQPGYGAGLAAMVGRPANAARIGAIIRSQVLQEAAVAPTPPPTVAVSVNPDSTVTANVQYTDAATNQTSVLSFPVS